MLSTCWNILKENTPDKFSIYPFLYQCTISFKLSSNSDKWRNYSVFLKRLAGMLNEKNKHFYNAFTAILIVNYLIGKLHEQKSNFTANDFRCVWISCAFFQNILACWHRVNNILSCPGRHKFRAIFEPDLVCYYHFKGKMYNKI